MLRVIVYEGERGHAYADQEHKTEMVHRVPTCEASAPYNKNVGDRYLGLEICAYGMSIRWIGRLLSSGHCGSARARYGPDV